MPKKPKSLTIASHFDPNLGLPLPGYAYPGDAGADLRAAESVTIPDHGWKLVHTGLSVEIPDGYFGLVVSRSGLAYREGLVVMNSPGIIDSGYRGEILVNLMNLYHKSRLIAYGERIAQLIIQPYIRAKFVRVDRQLSNTQRLIKGFGSSDTGDSPLDEIEAA